MCDDYESYKSHILENHEEGREYVICPLTRCGCPVRCVRTHFKAKHPHEKSIPKTDRKSTRLNSSHTDISRMPSSA